MIYPKSIQKLIDLFSKFPTVGPRTASRFVFYLLNQSKGEVENLISAVDELKKNIKICQFCFNPFEGGGELCQICQNPSRDKTLLCIIEKETDLVSIEKTKKYQGLYFILGGTISTLKKTDIEKLRFKELEERIKDSEIGEEDKPSSSPFAVAQVIKEIILAINPTTDGEATALYLERILKPFGKKITRLGRGLPVGAELEYADEETLGNALEGRK